MPVVSSSPFSRLAMLFTLLVPVTHADAQDAASSLPAVFTAIAPVIDGHLDDPQWQPAPVITDFHQLEPVEYAAPSELTEVRVLYDHENLYVGARLHYSDMGMLTANFMTPRQRIWTEDRLYIVLDPFLNRRNGYLFEANAFGVQGDALIENNSQRINEWSGVWKAQTTIDDRGWNVEFRIPLATVSFDPASDEWGFNVMRDIKQTQERLAWSSQGRQELIEAPSGAGTLIGLSGLKSGIGLDLIPSASWRTTRDFVTGEEQSEFEPSLDVTYRVTPSLTAKLTLNTDFSATEVDDRQVNLTRFSLFFPEKRNFFLQDAGIFEFASLQDNGRPFFSRTIGLTEDGEPLNLNAGGKLTGRIGSWNVGFLGVQQESSAQLGHQNLFVGRAAYNVLEHSSIGFLVTDGDPGNDRDARTLGVDFRYRDTRFRGDRILQADAWYQRTDNDMLPGTGPARGKGDDDAWGIHLLLPNDRHRVDTWVYDFGSGFDPAMGFVNRPGIRDYHFNYRYRARPQDSYWNTHDRQFGYRRIESTTDSELSETTELTVWAAETRQSDEIWVWFSHEREVLEQGFTLFDRIDVPPGDYEYTRFGIWAGSAFHRKWRLQGSVQIGDFLNGTRKRISAEIDWRPSPRFNLSADYSTNDVKLPGGKFTARVISLKSEIAFNNQWSFVPLVQFDNVSGEMGINLRLRFHASRGSDLFIVWNRNMLRDFEDRFMSTAQESVIKGFYTFRF